MATNSQPQETPEYRTFREHYDRLVNSISDPLPLATRLFARSVIDFTLLQRMNTLGFTTFQNTNSLLSAVLGKIQTDPSTFHVFLSALSEGTSTSPLVESMQRGLLSTTSGAHGGDESRDGGEEQQMLKEGNMSVVSGLESPSVHSESVTQPIHVTRTYQHSQSHPQDPSPQHSYQHQRYHHSISEPSYHSPFHPPPCHPPLNQYQPPIQSHTYQHSHCLSFQLPLRQPSYQHTEPLQPSYYQPLLQHSQPPTSETPHQQPHYQPHYQPLLQQSQPPTSETPHQQPHYQPHYQTPVQPGYMYQPPYQHSSPHHSPSSLGKHTYEDPGYHQTSNLQSSQPRLQTPFHPFYQTPFQAPVQPVHSYQPPYQPARLSPSQLLPPPPQDSPLGRFAIFLRGYYTQHHAPCSKWPQLDTRRYINLAVINNVYANRADLVQFREQTICGCIDDILEWKAPITMKEILQPNCVDDTQYLVTQLLIEGAPGIGKSTFAWEVCFKWGQHELFNEYSLVVLLKFRDKRVQEAKTVSDLFYHPNPKLQLEIVDDITTTGGHGLLLVLDGFDEAPSSKRTVDSIFVRLFRGQELPKATVILTTRPSASAELRELCKGKHFHRIEILGFGNKEIDEYIQCGFSDKQSRTDFKEYLSLYPHIHSMMYVPLNSAIVTHVYESRKSSGVVVPKTMTQLYSSLIRTLLLRHFNDKQEYKDTCININSFKDLPQPMHDQFCKICKIAYTGIMSAETELIFQDLPSDFDPLGLMQTCPELYVDKGASVSYNFLHLTLQEYLAAYHLSQQSRDEQVAFMREHIKNIKVKVVVRFLAGLTELGRDVWDVLRGFANDDNSIKLKILHCLFESEDPSAITIVFGSDCVCFAHDCDRALPFDLYILGYCITYSNCDWKLILNRCELKSVEIFLRALNLQQNQFQLPSAGQVKEVWLSGSNPAAVHLLVDSMPQMLVFHSLKHLGLRMSDLTSETCNLLSKHTDLLQHLECLDLSDNHNIGRGGAVNLITSLTKFGTIRELNLYGTSIGFEDCKALSELLARSKYIKVLNISISGNVPSSDSIQLIVEGLSHNASLEILNMSRSKFSSENILHLASVLRVNTKLKNLYIKDCNIQSGEFVHLAKALEENTTTQLQILQVWCNPVGSEGAVAFADVLATNKSLLNVNMKQCSIQGKDAIFLARALEMNSTLTEFDISYNPIGSRGAVAFAGMLGTNKTVAKINMRQCSIQGKAAICLAKALENNSTVRVFDISYNQIGSEGAVAFAGMLATNNSLADLSMSGCRIQEEVAVAFASMLKKNQCIKTLDLKDYRVGVEGALELIESLKHNTTLEKLRLSDKCKPSSFSMLDKELQDRVTFSNSVVF